MARGEDGTGAEPSGERGHASAATLLGTLGDTQAAHGDGDDEAATLPAGATVGRYVVLGELGRGGMGVVYNAYDPELDRKIALKLLRSRARRRSDTLGPHARLLREAQALARVSHPNVIAVHDVGTHEDAVFVAMELVEGSTLKTWNAVSHGWRGILDVLCRAGEGLRAAHEQGLVHRDFKPDNVLIGRDGRVRVADFGLARAADAPAHHEELRRSGAVRLLETKGAHSLDRDDHLTRTGAVLGTPAYMAPEQHSGRPGDRRTDVFSFCVTAYEALYGKRPFAGDTAAAVASHVLLGEVRPAPRDTDVPAAVYQALAAGLAVEPDDRPATMDALLERLRPAMVRRSGRWGLAVGLLTVTTAVGGYLLGTHRDDPCAIDRTRVAEAWNAEQAARLEAAFQATGRPFATDLAARTHAAIERYTTDWLEHTRAACEATHVQHTQSAAMLDLRMACLDRRLDELRVGVRALETGDDALLANALDVVRGLPEPSVCDDASALDRATLPPDPDRREAVEAVREQLAQAQTLVLGGRIRDALPLAEQATTRARALQHPPLTGEALLLLANVHEDLDRLDEARTELEEAMAAAIEGGDDRLAARIAIEAMYTVGYELSDLAGAEGWERQARGWLARLGRPDRLVIRHLDGRSILHAKAGRREAAMEDLREVMRLQAEVLDEDDPARANTLAHVADVMMDEGRYDEALEHYERALETMRGAYGPEHPSLFPAINNLGVALQDLGQLDRAEAMFEQAHALAARSVGRQSSTMALALRNLSSLDLQRGRVDAAVTRAREALEICEALHPEPTEDTASALNSVATALASAGRLAEATEYFRRAHEVDLAIFGPDAIQSVYTENNLGTVLAEQRRYEEGLPHLYAALADKERLLGAEHPALTSTLGSIGKSLAGQDACAEALPYFERAERILRASVGDAHPSVAESLLDQGTCHLSLDEVATALPLLERARELHETGETRPVSLAMARFGYARGRWRADRSPEAETLAREALTALEAEGPHAAEERAEVQAWLETPGSARR